MGTEHELRGHSWIVRRLASVPTADGRVLLASGDADGSVRVWDPRSGDLVAGPVKVDEVTVAGLDSVRLGSGTWALVTCGTSLKLWDPPALRQSGTPLWQVDMSYADALAVVPATAATRELIVTSERGEVRVIDPETGRTTFRVVSGEEIAQGVGCLAGGRFGDGTAGFAVVRFGGDVEFWALDGGGGEEWRRCHFELDGLGRAEDVAFFTGAHGDPLIAVTTGRSVTVWNLRTEQRVVRAEFDVMIAVLAPVPLEDRTLLALGFTHSQDSGVQLWDPHTRQLVGERFNHHGPAFGIPRAGGIHLHAVTCVSGPDLGVRVASAANDGAVRVSTPLDRSALPAAEGVRNRAEEVQIRITKDTSVKVSAVSAAIAAFTEAVEATPAIDRRELKDEYDDLRKSWGVRKLINGSPDEITEILRANLERDAERQGDTHFLVDFIEHEKCTQVNSVHGGQFIPYRVWRTTDGMSLYSSRPDVEQRAGGPRRWWRRT